MKIKQFEVVGLFGRDSAVKLNLETDLSILTGRNGAGKTSILKLLWYIISGNVQHAVREVPFQRATVVTSEYECTVHRINRNTCKVELITNGERIIFEDGEDEDGDVIFSAEEGANPALAAMGSSVFLPTFRRLEGGFTLTRNMNTRFSPNRAAKPRSDIEEALSALSRRMTNDPHVFVSSISTADIVNIVLQKYANLSELSNDLQRQTSQEIVDQIRAYKHDKTGSLVPKEGEAIDNANMLIDTIKSKIEVMEQSRIDIMMPMEAVKSLVEKLFRHAGIEIGSRYSFGDAANAINSDALSAGEKQMLSFICYNAFYTDTIFFIDEPELSLHVDWQRQLFPLLLSQQQSNQFIIATHSPFIYSKYPDREVVVDPDRGDDEGDLR
ncbi:AAA family ATPase [Agrobacterium tumefaciens]|uniref:AAA family ATPase n=1 Tax=Agrobacterium tumefaciens TaxID=358 RepID=UPI00384FC3E2